MSAATTNSPDSLKTKTNKLAIIGKSFNFEGNLNGEEDLRIEGTFEGTINLSNANVNVAKGGLVRGDIHANVIFIEGEVRGELRGLEMVEIAPCGIVFGDIRAPRVMLQDGCQFKGLVDMDHKEVISKDLKRPQPVSPSMIKRPSLKLPLRPPGKDTLKL